MTEKQICLRLNSTLTVPSFAASWRCSILRACELCYTLDRVMNFAWILGLESTSRLWVGPFDDSSGDFPYSFARFRARLSRRERRGRTPKLLRSSPLGLAVGRRAVAHSGLLDAETERDDPSRRCRQNQDDPSRRSSYARPTEAPPSFVVAILGRPSCLSHRSKAVLRRATTRTATATGRQRPRHEDGDCTSPTLDDLRTHPRELSLFRLYKYSLCSCSYQRILLSFA